MASPRVLDIERLSQPISAETPSGMNLRGDASPASLYYRIKDERSTARSLEKSADAEKEAKALEHWRTILELAPRVLGEQSKDLEVVAWLIESEVRINGFAGLRDGFRLARDLVDKHWDGLYPLPDEDGLSTRVAPLSGLNGDDAEGTLIVPIARVTITNGAGADTYAFWQYRQAEEISRIEDADKRAARLNSVKVSIELIQNSVRNTPRAFFADLVDDLRACIDEYGALCAALDARCGEHAPPTSNIRNAIQSVLDGVLYIARDMLPAAAGAGGESTNGKAETAANAAATRSSGGALTSRQDAIELLDRVSKFFRDTEPHSPLSYLIDKAARWGKMPLPELLDELIPDKDARSNFCKLTGIKIVQD